MCSWRRFSFPYLFFCCQLHLSVSILQKVHENQVNHAFIFACWHYQLNKSGKNSDDGIYFSNDLNIPQLCLCMKFYCKFKVVFDACWRRQIENQMEFFLDWERFSVVKVEIHTHSMERIDQRLFSLKTFIAWEIAEFNKHILSP